MKNVFTGILLFFYFTGFAQQGTISGSVKNENANPLAGASVTVEKSNTGTSTDAQGSFTITGILPGTYTISVSAVGHVAEKQTVVINSGTTSLQFTLLSTSASLDDVVVIGYGTQRKQDLTGSVTKISAKDFNKGPITTPEQLINGKVAGVQVLSNSGAPGSGSTIRIRSGSSLNASNDPLIVVDGVPLDNNGIAGAANPLSLINPNDIESFNILKDASATAIYGSRASNGVIIITTKKGISGNKLNVNITSLQSVAQKTANVDVLSAEQFRTAVNSKGTAPQKALLGNSNTNWQDVIYRSAFKTDNNISFSGGIKSLPYRLSVGYLNEDGILKTSSFERTSAALNLSPKFLNNHLSVNLNLKGAITNSRFANQGAIGSAVSFDPTQPVYANNPELGGYYEWLDSAAGTPTTLAGKNPLSILEQERNISKVKRSLGNLQLDYKFHFLPELRANLNLGFDVSKGEGSDTLPGSLAGSFFTKGSYSNYSQSKKNKLLEFYFNYVKDISSIASRIDLTAGYSYQDWMRDQPAIDTRYGNGNVTTANPFKTQNTLISYFGRLNYSLKDKYLLTATVRRDGSSRFSEDTRWGVFPSAAFAWKINEESFLKNSKAISDLKLRLGYGVTGQQDVGQDYPYLARYTISDGGAMYGFGDEFYYTYRPQGYDANIKWEETTTFNAGLDLGLRNGRVSFSLDYFVKKTKDLLSTIPVPAGSNLTNLILTNVGNIENKGFEFTLNATPVKSTNFRWDLNFNLTHYASKITNLSKTKDTTSAGLPAGGISFTGTTIQIHSVGYTPYSFYVYHQLYDGAGAPIEGSYQDVNKDGVVNEKDFYRYKSPNPTMLLGFSSQFSYKKWALAFTMRANLGNYMYNSIAANIGTYKSFSYANFLNNVSGSVLKTNFENNQYFSDYYVEKASFVRMDNINLGYNFGKLIGQKVGLTINANVQNAFVISGYSGLDPEVPTGIDNNFYPRPRIYSLGLNFDF